MIYTFDMKVRGDMHIIRKHILRVLSQCKWARFRDMRPPNIDSNLYSYHLRELVKKGLIEHVTTKGYRLSPTGLRFVDHVSLESFEPRWQPKILTKVVAIHKDKILMWQKYKQPFIGKWSLPSGKMHYEDTSVHEAMIRELGYFVDCVAINPRNVGVIEYNAYILGNLVSHTIAHIFVASIKPEEVTSERAEWVALSELNTLKCSPGTRETIEAVMSEESYFYRYFDIDW